MRLYVADYSSASDPVKAAIDAASPGDSIYFTRPLPSSPYVAPAGGWQITKSLELYGDGPGPVDVAVAAVLKPFSSNSPGFEIIPPASNVYIHDLQLQGVADTTVQPNGVGIRCRSDASNPAKSTNIILRGLQIMGFAGNGIHLEGYVTTTPTPVNSQLEGVTLADCRIRSCRGAGVLLRNVLEVHVSSTMFENNRLHGLLADMCRAALYACTFDANCTDASSANDGNLKFKDCPMARVDATRFLNFGNTGTINKACVFEGGMGIIGSCYFVAQSSGNAGQGILVTSSLTAGQPATGPVAVLGNRFAHTSTLINITNAAVDCTVLPQYSETPGGTITLPSPNNGMLALPHIIRAGTGSNISGLIIPSGPGDPARNATDGMLAYNTTMNALRARINGQWKTVATVV